ncbi:hypothetical protein ACFY1V_12535 [Streptomyces sp. NPDC001255]|uniref:hypothetical protein n=1 Tax=Streptomyces sp. NPDC001255 TaxID=3364550 RepID=UPI00368DF675
MSLGRDIDAADWTDDDLLTRDEAGGRLREEIAEVRTRLAALDARAPGAASAAEMLNRRLVALEKACAAL